MSLPLDVGCAENNLGWRAAEVGMRWVGTRVDRQRVQVREGACHGWRGIRFLGGPAVTLKTRQGHPHSVQEGARE